ncbi:hypothetical protein LJ655_15050 [Paraburkholderia sp. MMS20-SJTN17]|uniref:Uncharacterized protein n=1 Tax=Paraburkholderia translucens TaxID=2886945 RepID=A0ABS8KEH9_9BURK|nr:hypothetical protein [Paraburkholderia sp. MMS20-SJTN17]MCC8403191.1 hypothetical protein [Paraburkholderia sp. MMS20-SJTN17]
MEQQGQEGTRELMPDEEECLCCRVTYSIYSTFPSMPSAMAPNVETGEWFPFDRLRSYSSGYQMAEALGYAWACDCRERTPKRYGEQFTLKDRAGKPRAAVRYRVRVGLRVLAQGVTDSQGRTQRITTEDSRRLTLEIGGGT